MYPYVNECDHHNLKCNVLSYINEIMIVYSHANAI